MDGSEPSNFAVCATANTLGRGDESGLYRGTAMLNEAFLDRWFVVRMDYPPPSQECGILERRTGIPARTARLIVEVGGLARRAGRENDGINVTFSVRKTLRWATAIAQFGLDADRAFCFAILQGVSPTDARALVEIYQRATGRTVNPDALKG